MKGRFLFSVVMLVVLLFVLIGVSQSWADVPRNGLVAEYLFDGNANDTSGNGHNGTVNGATLTTDRFGRANSAYNFVGTSGNSITTSFVPPNTFSISLWYKANPTQLVNPGLFSTFSTGSYYGIYYDAQGTTEWVWTDGNVNHSLSSNANEWVHLVIVSANSNIQVYKNGNLVLSFAGTTTHAAPIIFGDSRFNGRYFSGTIDDIRIYNRALSDAEIQQLYPEAEAPQSYIEINGDLQMSGTGTIYFTDGTSMNTAPTNNISDIRKKKNIRDITAGLDFIKSLKPVEFSLLKGNDKTDFGFIAQDIEKLIGTKNNILGIGSDKARTLSLRYTDFIAPMVKAMQEQQQIIDKQNDTIQQIRKELAELKALISGAEKK